MGRPVAERNECQLIYAFVLGANPDAPPHLLDESRPYEVQRPIKSTIQADDINDPDTILLNIRENIEDGKSQTWFKYAAEIAKRYNLDYVAKCDTDSILLLHEFFMFAYTNLPPAPYNQHIYAGAVRDKAFFPVKKTEKELIRFESHFHKNFDNVHLYLAGQLYIMSTDLAEFVGNEALASNCSYCEGIEDHDISAMAFHSPDPISLKVIGRSHRFWEHPVKGTHRWTRVWARESARMQGIPFEGKMLPRNSTLENTLEARNLQEPEQIEPNAAREKAATTPKLEFVHITKTGGSAIEHAAATVGITWGACHYMELEEVGCFSPDLPYKAPDYQSYALTSPWHTPPKLLKQHVNRLMYPYNDADLFTIVRNPYSRVMSEYYCPWTGFQPKYRPGTVHEKDPNDPMIMNEWVKSTVKSLGTAMVEFNEKKEKDKVKEQAKGLNEDRFIVAQKHYVNQAEYVYDGDEIIVKIVVHYENLSSEFDALMKKYDINMTLPPKKEGVYSDAKKIRLSYTDLDPEAIALINGFAKVDFEKFGYQMVEKKFEESYSLEAKIEVH